jgi:hypothetical protein
MDGNDPDAIADSRLGRRDQNEQYGNQEKNYRGYK